MQKTIYLNKDKFEQIKLGKKKFEIELDNKNVDSGDKLIIIQRDEKRNSSDNKIIKKAEDIELTKNMKYYSNKKINKFEFKIIFLI
jgi:ASC-1-like (ASCH) protein